jgi:hypothetical protein
MSSIKLTLEGDAYRDLVVSVDAFIDDTANRLEGYRGYCR